MRFRKRTLSGSLLAWVALVSSLVAQQPDAPAPPPLVITVMDVGQADAILIETPDSRWILVDAGRTAEVAWRLREQYGVTRGTVAVGSHLHADHIGGMPDVLASFTVGPYVGDTSRGAHESHVTAPL